MSSSSIFSDKENCNRIPIGSNLPWVPQEMSDRKITEPRTHCPWNLFVIDYSFSLSLSREKWAFCNMEDDDSLSDDPVKPVLSTNSSDRGISILGQYLAIQQQQTQHKWIIFLFSILKITELK